MNNRPRLSRRDFLYASAATAGSAILTACGGSTANNPSATKTPEHRAAQNPTKRQSTPQSPVSKATAAPTQGVGASTSPPTTAPIPSGANTPQAGVTQAVSTTPAIPEKFNESPKLAAMVKAGKLPKVEERLPNHPLVLQPVDRVGEYGGTWHSGLVGAADAAWMAKLMDYQMFVRWNERRTDVVPNIAESFEVNAGGKEYVFHMREGMRWSDGTPFTADDIMFWYEDVLMNKDLTPGFPSWLKAGDKPVKVEKADNHSVVFRFAAPNGLFLGVMAQGSGNAMNSYPKHYMKRFHKKYNPKVVGEAKKANLKSWTDLFFDKANTWANNELPTLFPWVFTQPVGEGLQQVTAERNPYFWKADTRGNQLPYIDRLVFDVVQSTDVLVLKALNGEIDMQDRHIATLDNKAVFYKNQKKGNYHFFNTIPGDMNTVIIALNLTHKDAMKRKVFQNKDFRIGLSYAINRQEIIDVVYVSQGEPWQSSPQTQTPFYNERLAKQYTEHDAKKANEYLDKVLPKKDSQGRRLGPDGKPFFFQVDVTSEYKPEQPDVMNMVKKYWQTVGIDIAVKTESRDLLYTRKAANQQDAVVWTGDGGSQNVLYEVEWYFPYNGGSDYAIPWANWYNLGGLKHELTKQDLQAAGEPVEEPSRPAKQQMELYDRIKATPDRHEQIKLMNQILEIAADQFWIVGISLPEKGYGIVKNDFHNVPPNSIFTYGELYNTSQYFIKQR